MPEDIEQLAEQGANERRRFPTDLIIRVLLLLPHNDIALSARRLCRDVCQRLSLPTHHTVLLSQPLPHHARDAFVRHGAEAVRHMSFLRKLLSLSTAAASGSEANLSGAWELLQPSLFAGPLRATPYSHYVSLYLGRGPDPGTAAARAGHAHVLPWLVVHGCPMHLPSTLAAVARHCDLGALQSSWELLRGVDPQLSLGQEVLDEAAACADHAAARAKVEWVLGASERAAAAAAAGGGGTGVMPSESTAVAAARAGNLPLLQWLVQRWGVRVTGYRVLAAALRHSNLRVVEWLVGHRAPRGCGLLEAAGEDASCRISAAAAAAVAAGFTSSNHNSGGHELHGGHGTACGGNGSDCSCVNGSSGAVAKLRWLAVRGVALHVGAAAEAARYGNLEALRYLVEQCGQHVSGYDTDVAAGSSSVATATWLLARGCRPSRTAYRMAAARGDVDMIMWLVRQAGCTWDTATVGAVISSWPEEGPWCRWVSGAREAVRQAGGGSTDANRIRSGLRDVVGLFTEGGCVGREWEEVVSCAAWRGDMELVQLLLQRGARCEWGALLGQAATGGCEALVEWLVEQHEGLQANIHGTAHGCAKRDPYVSAGCRGDRGTLECLRRVGVAWSGDVLKEAVKMGCELRVLQWMVEHGAAAGLREVAEARRAVKGAGREGVEAWLRGLEGAQGGASCNGEDVGNEA